MAELERREARLKEVFTAQVATFREACYCLFGYRLDMASQVGPRVMPWLFSHVLLFTHLLALSS